MAAGRSLEREILVAGVLVAVVSIGVLITLLILVDGPVDPAAVEPAVLDVVQVAAAGPSAPQAAASSQPALRPAAPVLEEPDGEEELPRVMEPAEPSGLPREGESVLKGRVRTDGGAPVANARIVVERGRMTLAEGTSVASGEFTIGPMAPGHIRITVTHPLYAEVTLRYPQIPKEPLEVTVRQGGTIEGRVIEEKSGDPVARASVRTGRVGGAPLEPSAGIHSTLDRATTTDEAGNFKLDGLPPGQLSVVASAAGYASSKAENITLEAGSRHSGLVLKLQKEGIIVGKVVDDTDGKPIPRAMVVFRPAAPAGPVRARTSADGVFQLKGVSPGTVSIEVSRTGYMTRWLSGLTVGAGDTVQNVEVRLQRPGGALDPSSGGQPGAIHETPKLQYAGIGARLSRGGDGIRIESVFPGSPAASVGLQQGDVIMEVDGKGTAAMQLTDVVELIKGQEGRLVNLLVRRADGRTELVQPVRQLLNL